MGLAEGRGAEACLAPAGEAEIGVAEGEGAALRRPGTEKPAGFCCGVGEDDAPGAERNRRISAMASWAKTLSGNCAMKFS